ncbi:pancreatic lipase-related protein 2-like isoform X2 [Hemicordylus capensis]|nr:pancreatic lipase-related protein 2-like isoform X2 [Hemicordylus capensis]XP_053168562.1 pancreatic lipase-related protein 2-like isoform X2 [Hemicordylus capensis]XP_053168563.1 pancreatic lipase-related protein 2-like isoform X2 [Hemicordylus capensis]
MNITFSLFTKETGNMSQEISATNISTIRNSYFSPLRKTRFVIHGYTSTGKYGWVVELCLLLVKVENINCIAVDWEDGAKCTYFIASSNTRVLGAEIAYLINTFTKMYAYCPAHIHLIGHSLGAHTAGEAGRRLRGVNRIFPGLGRITGLDPAGLCFEGFPPMVRLDPSDAEFVDVIHTNAGSFPTIGYGMVNATGDLDFYPNGGTTMSGCDKTTPLIEMDPEGFVKELRSVGNCHHSRSYEYYRYSILFPEGFLGYPCESYKSFEEGQCFPCPREGCPFMGHYADKFRYKRRKNNSKYYLNTAPEEPFTSWRYNISVKLSGMKNVRGEINIAFYSKDGTGKDYPIVSGRLNRGDIYSKLTDVEINPENAGRVEFLWHKKAFTLLWAELGAERVRLVYGKDGHESFLCGSGTVRDEVSQILTPC